MPDPLIAMGYGGTQETTTRTQLSYDGGAEGNTGQGELGLSGTYVLAKCYAPRSSIGRPAIQSGVGQHAQVRRTVDIVEVDEDYFE